ncbi:ABC transporter permease [Dactylosporangium vinaceum]|uniref:ABC transporter permease n=1 Tax=Dactylosporangium vinaceum TaxID=53362 RepID=A0ABV5MH92_9ACTN|nr:ABC transporter permease [Dactylosporangium vinaceum]UAB94843.1 ABC transporter permease [Dactylosporangium vinaceum]
MRALTRLTVIEAKLMLREIAGPAFTILLPAALLVIFGLPGSAHEADPALGGHRGIDTVIPSMSIMVSMAMVAFFMLPVVLATYREKGILRRFATTPVRPAVMLGAQLVLNVGVVLLSIVLTLVIGVAALDMHLPNLALVIPTFVLGVLGLFPIGLLVSAVAGSAKAATGYALALWFPSAFFAGLYVPVEWMPATLRRIGDFTPLGAFRQAIQAAWAGDFPHPQHLAVLAAGFLLAGGLAIRFYRVS